MAIPDWTKKPMTYEQYYLPDPPKVVAPPRLSDHIPTWMWRYISSAQRESIINCHRIEVSDNPISFTTDIDFFCPDRSIYRLMLTYDMITHSVFGDEMETFIRAVQPPPLPVISSPYPVLGWRQWSNGREHDGKEYDGQGMFGLYKQRWETPEMRATCYKGHTAPAEDCRCGIYFTKDTNRMLWGGPHVIGLVVATDVIEHEYGYRAGLVRCIAITNIHPEAYGWDGISILNPTQQHEYASSLREDPSLIPYPNDLPAP